MMMSSDKKRVLADVKLLKHQLDFVLNREGSKFPAIVGGFGCGKTEAQIFKAMFSMFKYGNMFNGKYPYAIYLPSYDLVRTIYYPRFEEILNLYGIKYKLNKHEKMIFIHGYGYILFRSMDDPSKIVGYETADCGIDELDTLSEDLAEKNFTMIMGRNRKRKPNGDVNTIGITTTPEGFRFVWKNWVKKTADIEDEQQREARAKDFRIIKGRTVDNPFLSQDYIDNLLEQYPSNLIKAYMDGEFVNLVGNVVYHNFNRATHLTKEVIADGDTLHIGMDFNVSSMSAVVHIIRPGMVYAVDEIVNENGEKSKPIIDTPHMIKEIQRRYKGHKIFIYPDASGDSRKSVNASETDITLLKKHFVVRLPKDRKVKNRIDTMNGMFLNGKGEIKYKVNLDNCPTYVNNLEQQIWDKFGEPDKTQGHDHMLDAAGYFIYYGFRINRQTFTTSVAPR